MNGSHLREGIDCFSTVCFSFKIVSIVNLPAISDNLEGDRRSI